MKLVKQLFKACLCFVLACNLSFAQDDQPTMFVMHTDYVNFDKLGEYEELAKKLKEKCEEHNVQGANWSTASTEDGRYMYVSPIKNMAELDENPMSELFEKMGKEEAGSMFSKMDECYDRHGNEVIYYIPELSYNPEGYSREGMNSREWHFLYYSPSNGEEMGKMMESIKKMFAEKGIKNGYNVYHSGFGSADSFFVVSVAGKNGLHLAQVGEENDELLGEDGDAEFYKLIQLASKYDQVDGAMRPDLSYTPAKSE